jgi:hypothetical protein
MMIPDLPTDAEPTVGLTYRVPTAFGLYGSRDRTDWWPILGSWHEDAAIIGFGSHHYHFDFRFFSDVQWDYLARQVEGYYFGAVLCRVTAEGRVIRRDLVCMRPMPIYPTRLAPWLGKLQDAYRDHRLKDDLICPHKGAPLKGLPVRDGCVTCPLHGLRWDMETRRLAGEVDAV